LAVFAAACALFFLAGTNKRDDPPLSDPLSERAFRAVSIASALSAAARGQLDALDENDRIGVKSVLEALDRSAERVEKLLSEGSGDAEILSSAVEELEKRLGEILTEPEPEAGTQKKEGVFFRDIQRGNDPSCQKGQRTAEAVHGCTGKPVQAFTEKDPPVPGSIQARRLRCEWRYTPETA